MTLGKAIETIDRLKPNMFTQEDKVRWISELDALIWQDLISTHEPSAPCAGGDWTGYPDDAEHDTELLVKFPHDNIYIRWLESQIDLHNKEIAKYNNSRAMFNNAYVTYTDWYNRTHMPKQVGGFRFTEGRRAGDKDALSS